LNASAEVPFLNRATLGLYPPGSIFKIITMATALETERFRAESIYNCGLDFREIPGLVLYDWRYGREMPASGEITLKGGLERSCNPWFYHIGLDLFANGFPEALSDMAKSFGLGQETGFELGDDAGLVPDPENKREIYGEDWLVGDPVQMAIGQSYLQVTPLQVARYIAAIGNGGTLLRPQIVERIQNAEGEIAYQFEPDSQSQLSLNPENLASIQEAMVNVIQDPQATGYRRFLGLNLNVAGKTGTATSGETTEPHAWFAGYTFEEQEDLVDIAVVVLLENQGEGSEWAAPIFRRIVEAYFKGRPISLYPWESRIGVVRTPEPEEEITPTPEP
jgi:penicillin-binding protein 2